MHQLFFLFRIYPYWALPSAFCLGQIGLYFRRRHHKAQFPLYGASFFLIGSTAAWLYFRGDLHADKWLTWLFQT